MLAKCISIAPSQIHSFSNHLNKGPRTCRYAQRRLQKINELLILLHSQKTTQFQQLPFSLQSTHNPQDQKARTKLRWVTGRQSILIVTIFVHKIVSHTSLAFIQSLLCYFCISTVELIRMIINSIIARWKNSQKVRWRASSKPATTSKVYLKAQHA